MLNFPGIVFDCAVGADDAGFAGQCRAATGQSPGRAGATLGEQSYFAIGENLNLADDSIAAAMFSLAAAAGRREYCRTRKG